MRERVCKGITVGTMGRLAVLPVAMWARPKTQTDLLDLGEAGGNVLWWIRVTKKDPAQRGR